MAQGSREAMIRRIDAALSVDTSSYLEVGRAIIECSNLIDNYFYSTSNPDKELWRELFLRAHAEGPWAGSRQNPIAGKLQQVPFRRQWPYEIDLVRRVNAAPDAAREARKLQSPPQKSGCYIATAVYGSYEAPEVRVLRNFRDQSLSRSTGGRGLIRTYYTVSPLLARHFVQSNLLNQAGRKVLDAIVRKVGG